MQQQTITCTNKATSSITAKSDDNLMTKNQLIPKPYKQQLLQIDGDWFDIEEYKKQKEKTTKKSRRFSLGSESDTDSF